MASLPKVAEAAAPVVAMVQGARAALDAAATPEAVESVRARLDIARTILAAALRDEAATPEEIASAKRDIEQLAVDAAVKLGEMVPEGHAGARKDLGSTSSTVDEVAKRCGVPRTTLLRYRDLAAAAKAKAKDFADIVREAINAGSDVPFGRLIALVKPPAPKPDKAAPPAAPKQPSAPPATSGAITDPKGMTDRLVIGQRAPVSEREQQRQEQVKQQFPAMREALEREDDIKFCGGVLNQIKARLAEARSLWDAMEFHPLPAVRLHDRELPHPRDVEFQRLSEFFDNEVPAATEAATKAAGFDHESVTHLREQRDKAAKRGKAVRT